MKKNILYLLLGQIISVFGGAILRFALSLYVLDKTGRADIFAGLLAISSIPVLFAPIGGAIADRFNRRDLMVLMDVANAVFAILLYFVLGMSQPIVFIGILLFLLAVVGSFDTPVVNASIPLLVEDHELEKVNGMVTAVLSLSQVAAPILGGILYSLMGAQLLVISSTVFFILAAIIESFLKIPFQKVPSQQNAVKTLMSDLAIGFKEVKRNPVIMKAMFLAALVNGVVSAFFIVGSPILLRVVLGLNDTWYGVGMAIISFSSILGAVIAGTACKKLRPNNLFWVFVATGCLLLLMTAGITLTSGLIGFCFFALAGLPIGMLMSIISIYLIGIIQRITPKVHIGKVMASIIAVAQCAMPLGQVFMGILFKGVTTNAFVPLVLISIASLLIAYICYRLFRHTHDSEVQVSRESVE